MTNNDELIALIERLRAKGATIETTLDPDGLAEGRELIGSVTVSGVRGIGPDAMAPIAAAERMRDALAAIRDYENRIDAKAERLEGRADRLRREGEARIAQGHKAFDAIPFGQPILVGHYSEKRDRNYRERARNNLDKGFQTLKAAGEVAARAAAIGTGGVSSDDPTAVAQLREKLAKLEALQAKMAAANKLVRKGDVAALAEFMGSPAIAAQLMQPDCCGRLGFAGYQLSNNNANIRRIRQRIEALERDATRETVETEVAGGVRIVENAEANRLQLFFPGKPPAEIRTMLKTSGFRWSPSEGAWQRHLGAQAKWCAEGIVTAFAKAQGEELAA